MRLAMIAVLLVAARAAADPPPRYAVVRIDQPIAFTTRPGGKTLPGTPGGGFASYRVVGEAGDWIALENLTTPQSEDFCHDGDERLDDLQLRFYVRRADLVPVSLRPLEVSFRDGTRHQVGAGYPIKRDGARIGDLALSHVAYAANADDVGAVFAPAVGPRGDTRFEILRLEGELGGRAVAMYGRVIALEQGKPHLLTARLRCATTTLLVDDEMLRVLAQRLAPAGAARSGDDLAVDDLAVEGGDPRRARWLRAGSVVYHPDGEPAGRVRRDQEIDEVRTTGQRSCFAHRSGLTFCVDARLLVPLEGMPFLPPPAAAGGAPHPQRVSGPTALAAPKSILAEAAALGISRIEVHGVASVDARGKVTFVTLLRTSGWADFDEAALRSVRDAWRFTPVAGDVRVVVSAAP